MTIANPQTMKVPDGVVLEAFDDWMRNCTRLRVTYQDRQYEQTLTIEAIRSMPRETYQSIIDDMVARVMAKPELIVMNQGMPEPDLPGGLVNFPVVFMDEGDYVAFQHPLWPDETFQVRFGYSSGPWTEVWLEWPGHGKVRMPRVRAANTIVRDVIQEAMAMASVLLSTTS